MRGAFSDSDRWRVPRNPRPTSIGAVERPLEARRRRFQRSGGLGPIPRFPARQQRLDGAGPPNYSCCSTCAACSESSPENDASSRLVAEPNTILRGLVASTLHGLVPTGTDGRDEMGVCVEPRRYVVAFGRFEQWVYRSAAEREGHAGARSRHGDLDLTDLARSTPCPRTWRDCVNEASLANDHLPFASSPWVWKDWSGSCGESRSGGFTSACSESWRSRASRLIRACRTAVSAARLAGCRRAAQRALLGQPSSSIVGPRT
jgi:hypothetical protein